LRQRLVRDSGVFVTRPQYPAVAARDPGGT